MTDVRTVHKTLLNFEKRAENKPDEVISTTFVDAAPLLDILQAPVSQVIFGRRGTGKTHALKYCLGNAREEGQAAVYLDIRSIGSNGSFYSDNSVPEVERGLALVNDILKALLDELYILALARIEQGWDSTQITIRLDDMAHAIGNVRVSGVVNIEEKTDKRTQGSGQLSATAKIDTLAPSVILSGKLGRANRETEKQTVHRKGHETRFIDFAQTQGSLRGLLDVLGVDRMWLFLDEWSETPRVIQPYLADLIRKTILPTGKVIVKIAAIEQRSAFVIKKEGGDYIGLELGADISADLNLGSGPINLLERPVAA